LHGSDTEDVAFLAMTQHQLGHAKEAQAELKRLRERMKDPRYAQADEAQGFLREAEALLAKPQMLGGGQSDKAEELRKRLQEATSAAKKPTKP
jgi:hypothetical protein